MSSQKTRRTFYYLILFNNKAERTEKRLRFTDEKQAMEEYGRLEQQYRDDHDREVVLIGADSIETVKKTHSRYFGASSRRKSKHADPFPPKVKSGRST